MIEAIAGHVEFGAVGLHRSRAASWLTREVGETGERKQAMTVHPDTGEPIKAETMQHLGVWAVEGVRAKIGHSEASF